MAKLYFKVGSDWEEVVRLRNEIAKLKQELMSMDGTQSPAAFKALNVQLAASNQRLDELVTNAAKAGAEMEGDFKKKIFDASQVVNGLSEKITLQRGTIQQLKNELSSLKDKYREALKQDGDTSSLEAKIKSTSEKLREQKSVLFNLTQEQANARLSVKKLRDEYELYNNDGKEVVATNEGIAISWKKALAVIGGVSALKALGSEMIRVRGEFQSIQTAIETMVGKDVAGQLIPQIKELAKISPLTMSDIVGAEKMMLGFNIQAEDTIKYMKAISDISMGESGKFNSLTLAFSQMSAAGKLMGQDLNQMINAGFNPLQQISEKTGKSIATLKEEMSKGAISAEMVQQAFIDATSAGGKFYNMSENASKTINGQLSMMQDAMDAAFNELGQKSEGVIMKGIQMTTSLIENYETVGKVLVGLVTTYGAYRTAVMLVTVAENGYSAATMIMRGRILLAQKAQALLNTTMLKNPYVLLATVAIGAASAVWAFSKRTTEAQEAQERYNASKEDAIRKEEAHRQEIQRLISVASDEAQATANRNAAIESLKKAYPGIIEKYIDEEGHLTNLIQLQKDLNEEQSKRKIESNQEKLVSINAKVRNQEEYVSRMSGSEEAIKEANDVLIELQRQQKEAQSAVNSDYINARIEEAKKLSDSELKKSISQWKSSLSKVTGDMIGDFSRDEVSSFVKSLETLQSAREKQAKNKKYWEIRKKEAESARDALDVSKKNSEEWNKYTKQIQEAQKQIDKYSSPAKQESAAKKLRKQQEGIRSQNDKISEIERKQAIQRKRRAEDMEMEISQSEIDAMTEGAEKKRMQRELDNRKEIQSLERQKEDMIQAVIQAEKEIFDAQEELKAKENNKYQKKTFDSSKVDTGKISSIWDTIIENTSKKQLDDKIRDQEASWNEYLIKFGNYQQKRLAIIEKYDKAIKEAETAGDAAILMKEKANALDDFDNSVKNSTTLMGQLFVDASQKSVNEIQGIIEKAELLMQYLAAIKDEQGNAQIGGKTVSKKDILGLGISDNTLQNLELSTEQVEALRNAIDRLKGELGGKSPFKLFKTQVKQATDKIAQGGKKNIVQGISEIGSAVTQFTPAISQFGQDLGTIFGNDDLGNKIAGISDALGGVGQTAMGVGQIMSGDIVGGAMSAVSGISSVVKALDGLFGADYSRYNEMKSQYEALDSVWDTLIDKKKEYIKMSYGDEAYKVGKEAETLIKQQTQRYYELLNELRQSGSSIGSSSLGKRIEKRLSKKDWDRISGAVGESVTNAESLLNLSAEQLKEVLADPKLVSVLNTVNGDFVKYIQDIVNGSEKLEDIQNQVKEQLTQVSFDSVFDNFVDTLMDMDSSAKDFANNFERYMQKAMLTTMLGNKYKAELQKWYDAFAAANDNKTGISEEDYKKLQEQWNDIVTDAVKERDKLKELLGWTSESSSQDSTKRGFEAMSQDTGEELNGRFTALQASNEEIKNQSVVQSQALNLLTAKADTILSVNTEVRNIADDTRNLIANSYLELMQISENTGAIVKPIQQMQKDIAEVKKNTAGLAP